MKAYLVIDIDVKNPKNFKEYEDHVFDVVRHFGGHPIALDDNSTVMEGDWKPKRCVILEFPSKQNIEEFFNSEMYEPLKIIRRANSVGKAIAVEGV
ncbi:DUF1330 domain-containing protein [Clostridium beijerinckii]|uniref:Uncharacterized protein n=1 Tax=Clostridium beijerinckii TaxID=1520 RepID=A0A1S8RR16_CLOBE|nr:DUF1330 domain-containing protein [Clostridium beijerinckii]MBA8933565.1 uncharacterized protein (DUF1330 family) [Clostridium beijerinckii]NRU37764.1 uncharacterized protein (DUF1330 family) [Clostridium beijerinckii]NRY61672.1 uncharacterized protein (DUF1330 family) [Clostridium beijerinckii]NSA98958.1 uncharacterized protein (DUF1330 family) [Clostridium beijerinckii]OOM55618.1 hypothetical protein CLOBI_44080 [Clostridium beijerinckii]